MLRCPCSIWPPYVSGTHCVAEDGLELLITLPLLTGARIADMCHHIQLHFLVLKVTTDVSLGSAQVGLFCPLTLHRALCAARLTSCHQPPTIMIIYRDLISYDEPFSDIYEMWQSADKECLEVAGHMVSRTEGSICDPLIDGNASAEEEGEGAESTVVTRVDIMNHRLEETALPKRRQKSQQRLHEITQRSYRAD